MILKNKFRTYILNHLIDIFKNNSKDREYNKQSQSKLEQEFTLDFKSSNDFYKRIINFLKLWKIKSLDSSDINLYIILSLLLTDNMHSTYIYSTLNYYINNLNYNDSFTFEFVTDFLNMFKIYNYKCKTK
jgi:hypothetical protein